MRLDKRWTQVFKIFSNVNRVRIVTLLMKERKMTVTEIAEKLEISFKSASQHLILLEHLDILESRGKEGYVFYSINQHMPRDIRATIRLFYDSRES